MNPAALLEARVPRYTSYPTAPHFSGAVGATTYRTWLEALPVEVPLSLYLHIPFCDTLCWFCGCHTSVINRYSPVNDYLQWLDREIELVAAALGGRRRVAHVHWGGGSPTLLQPSDIIHVADQLRTRFELQDDCEFAVEIDPRGLSAPTVNALAAAGVNRASIGVQDCDAKVQRAINRIQPIEETSDAVRGLRDAGIVAVNFDIMYGLPHQTVEMVERTIDATLALEPQRYAVFGYAHVPHFKKHQALISEEALPDGRERLEQCDAATRALTAAGFEAIGLDHFARPADPLAVAARGGRLRRNFQGYTTDAAPALIGFGASAIGALPQGYAQNAPDVPTWRRSLAAGYLATARGIAVSPEDRLRRSVIERLMCDLEVDLDLLAAEHGFSATTFAPEMALLEAYARDGMISSDGGTIRVQNHARSLVRIIASVFDTYLRASEARHSVAV